MRRTVHNRLWRHWVRYKNIGIGRKCLSVAFFCPVVMSATPPPSLKNVFRDRSREGQDSQHLLGRRQLAAKPTRLADPVGPVDKTLNRVGPGKMADAMVDGAKRLLGGQPRAIIVFANRVATARRIRTLLQDSPSLDVESILLTGRMRSVDREAVTERLRRLELHSSQSEDRALERGIVVVSTQTLEVGADLDFDGLVTECASLDSLRQRFGRLNRMGRDILCQALIFIGEDQAKSRQSRADPVYGTALTETWRWLNKKKDANGDVDFGISAMEMLVSDLDETTIASLNAPTRSAPTMLPAHIDCWAQTAPEPYPSPDVAPFLQGPQKGALDVQVCWRADIDLKRNENLDTVFESLNLCPPSSGEILPVPIRVFRRWLVSDGGKEDCSADVPHVEEEEGDTHVKEKKIGTVDVLNGRRNQSERSVIRWRGRQTRRDDIVSLPEDIHPGDVIVVPTNHPGRWCEIGDLALPSDTELALLDVGDRAHLFARAKPILRLHKNLVSTWPDDAFCEKAMALELLESLEVQYEVEPEEFVRNLRTLLESLATSSLPDEWAWLNKAANALSSEFGSGRAVSRDCHMICKDYLVLVGRRRISDLTGEEDAFCDDDNTTASGIGHSNDNPVGLRAHLYGVEELARRHAEGCGLSDALVEAVSRAGLLHDVGKADPRFQSLLRGGIPFGAMRSLAKSPQMPRTLTAYRRACKAAGFPEGGRHELLSARLAESVPEILPHDKEMRDLVLHLIESHHGHCRPFAPVVIDDAAPQVEFQLCERTLSWFGPTGHERIDSGTADRYWTLTRRYGWWGLAWLEALLRSADWRRSSWEEEHDEEE